VPTGDAAGAGDALPQHDVHNGCVRATLHLADGAEATQRCGACGGPFYCGAACQRQHWKAHRRACKAAAQTSSEQ
jgi:hypothetical protein